MAGFSEAAMSKRLQTLNTTQQSVQMMSMWLLHHQKNHAQTIVKVWLQEIQKETKPARLVNLLYLANDVIQNSRKHCAHFMGMFYENLEPAFRHVSTHADADAVVAMKKILRVFRERQIYPDNKVDRLVNAVASSLSGIRLVEFNIELGGTNLSSENIQKSRLTPTTPPNTGKTMDSPSHSSTPIVHSDSPEPKKCKVDSENFDVKIMTRVTEEVIALLKKLEDPPSADAETRQLIASFPETIANPALLKPIKDESQAVELLKKIKEAEPVVKEYCKRLSTEMEDRRTLQQLLPDYFDFLKASAIRNDEMLRSVREKVEKLEQEKMSVKEHFDSLPDLANLPTGALQPLPSLGELFRSDKDGDHNMEIKLRSQSHVLELVEKNKFDRYFATKFHLLLFHYCRKRKVEAMFIFIHFSFRDLWTQILSKSLVMGIVEKIQEIEHEINRTQKNKATEHHLGLLKAKLAKYRQQLLEPTTKGSTSKGDGFDVMKSGDARVAMVGFPSVGKSTLLSSLTTTESAAASYEFTTLTCIPGVIEYEGANIQLLDLPGIIEGASQGKGRGRQVIAVAKTADLIIMMLDAEKGEVQKTLLSRELESVGIRLNKQPPLIYLKRKKVGGVKFTHTVPLTFCSEKVVMTILHEYKIFNADVVFRDDCTVDEFIDVIQGNRVYIPCLYVYNKIDQISIEEVDRLARLKHSIVISCEMKLNMDYMVEKIWEYLALIRIYTKKPGNAPDIGPEDGVILRRGATVEHACHALHRNLASAFRYAIVWGTSTKFSPQRVGIHHKLHHEDVLQIVKK